DHDLSHADLRDEMTEPLRGEHQRVDIKLLQVLRWMFLELQALALLWKHEAPVIGALGVRREVAASMRGAEPKIRELVEGPVEDQMRERDCRLERIADDVAEHARTANSGRDAGRTC